MTSLFTSLFMLAILRTTYVTELNSSRTVLVRTVTQRCEIYMLRVMQHILICLLLKFHKILLFTIKVIHKKLRGSANYGPPCIYGTFCVFYCFYDAT